MEKIFNSEINKANIIRSNRDMSTTGLKRKIQIVPKKKKEDKVNHQGGEDQKSDLSESESDSDSEESEEEEEKIKFTKKIVIPEKPNDETKSKIKDNSAPKIMKEKDIRQKIRDKYSTKARKSSFSNEKGGKKFKLREDSNEKIEKDPEDKKNQAIARKEELEKKVENFRKRKAFDNIMNILKAYHQTQIKKKEKVPVNLELKEKEQIIKEKKEKKKKKEPESSDEDEESQSEQRITLTIKEKNEIEDQIMKSITQLSKIRRKGLPIKNDLFWKDVDKRELYLKYLKSLSDDEIVMAFPNIFIPPSRSAVNGILYETPGFTLEEIAEDTEDVKRFLQTYKEFGFEIPARLVEFASGYEPFSFSILLREYPFLFQNLGSPVGSLAVLSKPKTIESLGVLSNNRVAVGELGKMLGTIPSDYSDIRNNEEFRNLFYLDTDEIQLQKVSPNIEKVMEFYDKANKINAEMIQKNVEEVKKCCQNPLEYFKKDIPDVEILDDKQVIALINEKQHVKKMYVRDVAETIKTRFTFGGPDFTMCYIAANFVQSEIPDKALEYMLTNYIGTGGIKMLGERYKKSLEIYRESNTQENQTFHKTWYHNNFKDMLYSFGYYYDGPKIAIPKNYEEYINILDANGARLNRVNPHSKGTYTSFKKRVFTGAKEIEAGLKNWKNLERDGKNKAFQFFYIGFQTICAKLKDEIHSYEKPPRFYNPTFISCFIPFQLVFNKVFETCLPMSKKCPYSLLGIKDVDHVFSDLMGKIYKSDACMYHYSDNFWIKEGNHYVSVDVKRCDSNLSAEALYYPMKAFGKMVLQEDDYKKYVILCDLFVSLIPRGALFSFDNKNYSEEMKKRENKLKMKRKAFSKMKVVTYKKEDEQESEEEEQKQDEQEEVVNRFITMLMPFYWLPSGVVGTAYINHMFTGAFLYFSKDVDWIDTQTHGLSKEIQELAQKFGIHLEVASYYNFANLEEGNIVPFDLLGRSGMYLQDTFIPLLEESRVWKSLFFIKKKKYDISNHVGNFVRLAKLDSLIQLGGLLYPVARELIFSALVAFSSFLRKNLIELTHEQGEALVEMLDRFNIDPIAYEGFIYKGFLPNVKQYIYEKTGLKISNDEIDKFDKQLAEKFDTYYSVWGSLLPVIQGVETSHVFYSHNQYSSKPYNVMYMINNLLKRHHPEKQITVNGFGRFLIDYFGQSLGASIFSSFIDILLKEGNLILKDFKKEFKKKAKDYMNKKIEKGMKPSDAKKYVQDLITRAFRSDMKMRETFDFIIDKDKKGREYILLVPFAAGDRGIEHILQRCILNSIFERNSNLWYLLEKGDVGKRFNYLISKIIFDGYSPKEVRNEKLAAVNLPILKNYRYFPFEINSQIMFNPKRLRMENDKMVLNERKPIFNDLGYLTGALSNPAKGVEFVPKKEEKKGKDLESEEEDEGKNDIEIQKIKERRKKAKKDFEEKEEKEEKEKEKEKEKERKEKRIKRRFDRRLK